MYSKSWKYFIKRCTTKGLVTWECRLHGLMICTSTLLVIRYLGLNTWLVARNWPTCFKRCRLDGLEGSKRIMKCTNLKICWHTQTIVSKERMIQEIQGSTSDFLMKLSTCLLVVRIYPIHIKIIGVVQRYVLCPSLSFFCVIIIFTYVFKHGCACLKLEFGRFQQIYQFEGTVEYWVRGS